MSEASAIISPSTIGFLEKRYKPHLIPQYRSHIFFIYKGFTIKHIINFHRGQKSAILNTIYLHEILKVNSVLEIYEKCDKELIPKFNHTLLAKEKYKVPKYAMKMATGTGKTWVMNALFIWQYLNARAEKERSGRFTKNFLLIAPGLIVYERLLDSYMGKTQEDGSRDVNTSDIFKNRELFLPQRYEITIKAFLQSSVVKKDEIGRKITSDGFIAISNWHLFMGKDEEREEISPLDDPSGVIADIFPARHGVSAGNSLEQLDGAYFSGGEIEYLAELDDLVVMNDEAHYIHENKTAGETDSKVLKFIKILEFKHDFATISYFRDDGLMASYYPDFMVETDKNIYLVETKSDKDLKDLKDVNVKQKQRATLDFVRRINSLDEELREGKTWSYLLLGETQFYSLKKSGADIEDIAKNAKMNESSLSGSLFDN